ncbi:MAG: hypothetical protein DDT36_01743 [Firmicutes bacterium]|nr:hypothetical protein [Bacillota bacterium]
MGADAPPEVVENGADLQIAFDVSKRPFRELQAAILPIHLLRRVLRGGQGGAQDVLALQRRTASDGIIVGPEAQTQAALLLRRAFLDRGKGNLYLPKSLDLGGFQDVVNFLS